MVLKISKFQKKKQNEQFVLIAKIKGKLTGVQTKLLKKALNDAVLSVLNPIEESTE